MIVIRETNVNQALMSALLYMQGNSVREISPRGMKTLELPEPVTTVYTRPLERVLFNEHRDANPFFHFFESLWILSGRQDTGWLKRFNSNIDSFSDDGKVFNAAYGFRLREHFGIDQLDAAVQQLMDDPDSRRVVLTIWDVEDLTKKSKDIPCNDLIMFKIRDGRLNMTVCNRSNDLIWGCYGANVVHFSFIQEYVASKLHIPVGEYRQVSDSLHVYVDNPLWSVLCDRYHARDLYRTLELSPYPLMQNANTWDTDLEMFMDTTSPDRSMNSPYRMLPIDAESMFSNSFFSEVALPMYRAWVWHKLYGDGLYEVDRVRAEDWRFACKEWLVRRMLKKQGGAA